MKERYRRNINQLKKQVEQACSKAGRDPGEVTIIAATKYTDPDGVRLISELGIDNFGENRADELLIKKELVKTKAVWHFIGHLQSRKVRDVVPVVEYIHSIESLRTLEKIGSEAGRYGKIQKVLVEVNVSGEETKYGLKPDNVIDFITKAVKVENTDIKGLMTMAPFTDDMSYIRDIFRQLKLLKDHINSLDITECFSELSMGMSNDFMVAIEEGATMVRIGSSIFK